MQGRMEVLRLYKCLLRESQKFTSYNYRNYFLRRVRDGFKDSKGLSNEAEVAEQISRAKANLNIIRRQVIIGHLYQTHKLVIENAPSSVGG